MLPLAQAETSYDAQGASVSTRLTYLHTDQLYTPRIGTDASGTVVWRWDSDALGVGEADDDPDGDGQATVVPVRFPGQYYDSETGLHYNYFRDYNPATGRYLESDPIGLSGGLNTFRYAFQNPLTYDDSFGLSAGSRAFDYLVCIFRPEAMARGECGQKLAETAAKETASDLVDAVKDPAVAAQQCAVETVKCTWRVVIGDDAASVAVNAYEEYVELRVRQTLKAFSENAYKKYIPMYNA